MRDADDLAATPASESAPGHIAIVGPLLPFRGGIAHYNSHLLGALESCERDASFYSFARQYPRWLYPGASDRDPQAKAHHEQNVHYVLDSTNPVSWFRVASQIAAGRPGLVAFHWWTFYWGPCFITMIRLLKRKGIRIALICHNLSDHDSSGIKAAVSRVVIGMADAYFVHSEEHAEVLRARWPDKQIGVHPIPPYGRYPKAQGTLAKRGRLELLFFGFIRPYKGLDVLLEALDMVADADVHLSVVGEHWGDPAELRKELDRLPNVEMRLEYTSDLDAAEYFARADYVVLPYKTATPSAVASLAYHYDTPVIASRVRGLMEIVEDGVTGILVESNDAGDLAEAIRHTTREEADSLSRGVQAYKARVNWHSLCDALVRLA